MRVVFLKHVDNPEVFAFFPDSSWGLAGNNASYQHTGQHGPCSIEYANESVQATRDESQALQDELIDIGYDLLEVIPLDSIKKWTCNECEGHNLHALAWVGLNDEEFKNWNEEDASRYWCEDCQEHQSVSHKIIVKKISKNLKTKV